MAGFIVYEIVGPDAAVRFVGITPAGGKPWNDLWQTCDSAPASPLVDWVRTLDAPFTYRILNEIAGPMSIVDCNRWLAIRRHELKKFKTLLSPRPHKTYANCGGKRELRPVVDAKGVRHESVNAAARANGITAGRVCQLCKKQLRGWKYL
jgi:hypothetical protein